MHGMHMAYHPFSEGHLGPFDGLRADIKAPLPALAINNTLCTTEKTFLYSALSLSHVSSMWIQALASTKI